jgi:ORF6N domain
MLDFDLAELYDVGTKILNQAVKRNKERFPQRFMFRLTLKEWKSMRSQIVTASEMELYEQPNASTRG